VRISVFGLGYVGAVSLACLARDGHDVVGVDVDPHKLDMIRSGRSPIVEEGIQELMKSVVASGKVTVTNDVGGAIRDTELSFVCVGTPSSPNGDQDLTYIGRVMEQIGSREPRPQQARRNERQELPQGLCPVLPAGVPARRHVDQGLRQSADDDRRRG
jgi:nucleotide sugar dehydrogenase